RRSSDLAASISNRLAPLMLEEQRPRVPAVVAADNAEHEDPGNSTAGKSDQPANDRRGGHRTGKPREQDRAIEPDRTHDVGAAQSTARRAEDAACPLRGRLRADHQSRTRTRNAALTRSSSDAPTPD